MVKLERRLNQQSPKKPERRGESRFPYCRAFHYVAMRDPGRLLARAAAHGKILDLSNGGMKIRIAGRFPLTVGEIVMARIPLRNTLATVPTLAVVRWTKPSASGRHAGLRFVVD